MKSNLCFFRKAVCILVCIFQVAFDTSAQQWDEIMKSVAGDRSNYATVRQQAGDRYAYSVSVSGNYAVVGAMGSGPALEGSFTSEGLAYTWKMLMVPGNR